jgi:hypothetical protein
MPRQPVELRVDRLEDRVGELEGLPARVTELGAQITHLRSEMRAEFSAVRAEIRDGDEETRRLMRVLHEDLLQRIALLGEGGRRRRK